jgi:glutathione synthase/RimK-type ligase-like ATP-grasp enzyme
MTGWLIVVDRLSDLPAAVSSYPAMTTRDYIMQPRATRRPAPKILNLSRSYGYQTMGYYCSLLAEARGHKVVPTVTTVLELSRRSSYVYALAELEETLNRTIRHLAEPPTASFRLFICLGHADDHRFSRFARQLFDWFRCPILEVFMKAGDVWRVRKIAPVSITELGPDGKAQLASAIEAHFRQPWKSPKAKAAPRFTLAVLLDPKEQLPPSDLPTIRHFERIAEPMGLGVEVITKQDFDRIAEFDALWIRETTNIDHHTFRFAKRAEQEGMPVIDDSTSIIRCTNKVYLAELLQANGVPTPKTVVISSTKELEQLEAQLSYPMVLKIPDGSFSRGVAKVGNRAELDRMVRGMLEDSDLILAQEFMYTEYDWRVGVLDGQPLFVSQYMMARKHWQIVRHTENGKPVEGSFRTLAVAAAPREVVEIGVRAARLIGRGLYGVDVKMNERGVFVIEVNDNPNLVHDVEDTAERDEIWRRLAGWFLKRLLRGEEASASAALPLLPSKAG